MNAIFKSSIFLALAVAIGIYLYESIGISLFAPLDRENVTFVAPKPEASIAPAAPAARADVDEELDYMVARRIGSLGGWQAFLTAHGSGFYAQSARAEVEKLLHAGKTAGPGAAEVSNGASPDVVAAIGAERPAETSAGLPVATPAQDEICRLDEQRLEQLRNSRSREEAVLFANELGCEKLRPQLLGLMETLGSSAPAPAAAEAQSGSPDPKAASDAARPTRLPPGADVANASSVVAGTAATPLPLQTSAPDNAVPGVSDKVSPDAKAAREALGPAAPSPGRDVAKASPVVAGKGAAPLPKTSAAENAVRGVSDKESANAKAAGEAVGPAPSSPGRDVANAFSVVAGNVAAPPPARTSAPQDNAVRGVSDNQPSNAKAARQAVAPAPDSPGADLANASSVVAENAAAAPPGLTIAPNNAVRGVSDNVPPDARAAREAAAPAPLSPGPNVANDSAVVAGNAAAPLPAQTNAPATKAAREAVAPAPPSPGPDVANAPSVAAGNAAAAPPAQTSAPNHDVRGVSDTEILFGMAAPFSGASRELGRQMKLGVETAFSQINDEGGVNGRLLRLVAADDGYEPTRTAEAMQVLFDKDHVFGFIGNVGTPTAAVALPFALDHRALFFAAFSGANLLRRDPPDRYVFNYRASYAEETNAVVHYLVKVKRIQPKEIVVFAQQDSFGDSGYTGVEKAVRSLPGDNPDILRLNYKRNTVDVQDAVNKLRASKGQIKAVVMVASYRAAAKFIEKTRDLYPSLLYTNVSFVGSTALADELTLLGPRYAAGVIVTQVVPAINSYASIVLKYKEALAKYFPGEAPDYVSFEGYIDANILAQAVKRVGRDINTEKLVDQLEQMHALDLGLGTPVSFSSNEHQGSHKVWGTQLDEAGHYQPIDLW